MASRNSITGALLVSKPSTKQYEEGWDRIFGKRAEETPEPAAEQPIVETTITETLSVVETTDACSNCSDCKCGK